jgi:hypothetical protein
MTFSLERTGLVLCAVLSQVSLVGSSVTRLPITRSPGPTQRLVAEAPIWGTNRPKNGKAFLPVTIDGHQVTLMIDPNDMGKVALFSAGLSRAGVSLSDTATRLPALTLGTDVLRDLPIQINDDPLWRVRHPDGMGEAVGVIGGHFLASHYDLLYDFPHHRVRLYAFAAEKDDNGSASLPPEVHASDCGTLIPLPPNAPAFAAMEVQLDGHPVTGVIEWQPYIDSLNGGHDEKMNTDAFTALGLPAQSPRIQSIPGPHPVWAGQPVKDEVSDVHITVGQHTVWTGPVKIFSTFEVNRFLPPQTPVMLLNLTTISRLVLFYSSNGGKVCLNNPKL